MKGLQWRASTTAQKAGGEQRALAVTSSDASFVAALLELADIVDTRINFIVAKQAAMKGLLSLERIRCVCKAYKYKPHTRGVLQRQ